jgi:hypothetical protein
MGEALGPLSRFFQLIIQVPEIGTPNKKLLLCHDLP